MNDRLRQYLEEVRELPSMPEIASAVMAAVEVPDASPARVRQLISRDPAMTLRLLKVANSALYGFSRQIDTLRHAIALLGLKTTKNLVLALSLRGLFRDLGPRERQLFHHCSVAGPAAVALGLEVGIEISEEEVFCAGLLHDLGKLALVGSHPEQYGRVMDRLATDAVSSAEAEREEFGFDHAELGGELCERWRLSPQLTAAVRYHHDPQAWSGLPPAEGELSALIALTTACLNKIGVGRSHAVDWLELSETPAWTLLGLSAEREGPLLAELKDLAARAELLSTV